MDLSIPGNEKQKQFLEKISKNPPSGILFSGKKSIGKFFLAKEFIKMIFLHLGYDKNTIDRIDKNIFEDLLVLDKLYIEGKNENIEEIFRYSNISQENRVKNKAKTDTISIDDVNEIISLASKRAFGKIKIILIRDIERMNEKASNALLKTIEEPSEDTFFVLTSSNKDLLLPTILSRVQNLDIEMPNESQMFLFLQKKFPNIEKDKLTKITNFAFGNTEKAIDFCKDEKILDDYLSKVREIEALFSSNSFIEKINRANKITEEGLVEEEIYLWEFFLEYSLYKEKENIYQKKTALESLFGLKKDIEQNGNKKLCLENFYFSFQKK